MIIKLDISGALPTVAYDQDALQGKIADLAKMARAEWVRLAQTLLKSSSADYIAGIQPVEVDGTWATISLNGRRANEIENGKGPYDMKPGLLAGPHAKAGKSGRYNTVPFRHGTPGTSGRNVGVPMPFTGATAAGKPTSFIYAAAKKLVASVDSGTGKTIWGGNTGDMGGFGIKTQPAVKGGRPKAYTWKSSPYAGMYKVAKTYAKATQNQYTTFRRVSDKSDPASWWHPGIRAQRLVQLVEAFIRGQMGGFF